MAEYLTNTSELTSIADAIRTKGGTSASLTYPTGFVSAIENLPTGGIETELITRTLSGTYENSETTEVGFYAFANCRNLSAVIFSACTTIANNAFAWCENLVSANFSICTSVGMGAFENCYNLADIYFPECLSINAQAFRYCSVLSSVSFPKCITINMYAFESCDNLAKVSFPECTLIGSRAFNSCSALSIVSFPKCTYIYNNAFQNCSCLISADFPTCTYIYNNAFQNCTSLATANFPNCWSIYSSAFLYCSSLTEISFPQCLSIGSGAFSQCGFSIADFPLCRSIGASAFTDCVNLTSAAFSGTPLTIDNYAFKRCYRLLSLYLLQSWVATLSNSNAFDSTPIAGYTNYTAGVYGSIYVRASLINTYKNATNWSVFSNRFVAYQRPPATSYIGKTFTFADNLQSALSSALFTVQGENPNDILFKDANNVQYAWLNYYVEGQFDCELYFYSEDYGSIKVYNGFSWENNAYKTITFLRAPCFESDEQEAMFLQIATEVT